MIIIRMQGGLGNQLFQYALYLQLADYGADVRMDEESGFVDDVNARRPVLREYFGIDYEKADRENVIDITDAHMDLKSRIRRKLLGRRSRELEENRSGNFDPSILALGRQSTDVYLNGYWQSERYFPSKAVRERIIRDIRSVPDSILTAAVSNILLPSVMETQSVSIHVRRGDYLSPGTVENFGGICDEAYYARAVERVTSLYPDSEFYVFCIDKEWARENFRGDRFVVVDTGEENEDLAEFILMRHCRHHILANSSYSWWAAYAGDDETGMIIAPSRWMNNREMNDIYTSRMERL